MADYPAGVYEDRHLLENVVASRTAEQWRAPAPAWPRAMTEFMAVFTAVVEGIDGELRLLVATSVVGDRG